MGRFESSAEFYRYREPYPDDFFHRVAKQLELTPQTNMLDVACGPGNLSFGFARFVGHCTGIDIEPAMLRLAREAAATRSNVEFIQTPIEEFESDSLVDFVTIGRAVHWLPRDRTIELFEKIVAARGCIAICDSKPSASPTNKWAEKFRVLRQAWSVDQDHARYNVDLANWFSTSPFRHVAEIVVPARKLLTVEELVGRALSFSGTSPAALGTRRMEFESDVRATIEPFANDGLVEEEVVARAVVFARPHST